MHFSSYGKKHDFSQTFLHISKWQQRTFLKNKLCPHPKIIYLFVFLLFWQTTQKYTLWQQSILIEGFFRKSLKNQTNLRNFVWGQNLFWRSDLCGYFIVGPKKNCWESQVLHYLNSYSLVLTFKFNMFNGLIFVELGFFVHEKCM